MPAPLNFSRALERGYTQKLKFDANNTTASPKPGKKWLILYGRIYHVTATDTTISIRNISGEPLNAKKIQSAAATGFYPLFCANTKVQADTALQADHVEWQQPILFVVEEDEQILFSGDASAYAFVKVLEW